MASTMLKHEIGIFVVELVFADWAVEVKHAGSVFR